MAKDKYQFRAETPGTEKYIHLNNAGSSLMPEPVMKSTTDYLLEEFHKGGYETAADRQGDLDSFYQNCAEMLNAHPDEIAYTDSATTSWQRAFFSINWNHGDEIITGNAEYASNYLSFLRLQQIFDVRIRIASDNQWGETSAKNIAELVNSSTKLIAITHMPTLNGLINPVEEIGRIAKSNGIIYLVDACQSVGHIPLDVEKIGCDILSGTGRKYLRGPRGTGLLYVSVDIIPKLLPMSMDLFSSMWVSSDEFKLRKNAIKFEIFESNLAAKAGLSRAIRYYLDAGPENCFQMISELAVYLRNRLKMIKNVKLTDIGKNLSGIVCIEIPGKSPFEVSELLKKENIHVSAGAIQNSRLLFEKINVDEVLRISVHYFNTKEEIDKCCQALERVLSE